MYNYNRHNRICIFPVVSLYAVIVADIHTILNSYFT